MFLDPPRCTGPFGTHADRSLLGPCRLFSHDPDPRSCPLPHRPRNGSRWGGTRQGRGATKDKPVARQGHALLPRCLNAAPRGASPRVRHGR